MTEEQDRELKFLRCLRDAHEVDRRWQRGRDTRDYQEKERLLRRITKMRDALEIIGGEQAQRALDRDIAIAQRKQ